MPPGDGVDPRRRQADEIRSGGIVGDGADARADRRAVEKQVEPADHQHRRDEHHQRIDADVDEGRRH